MSKIIKNGIEYGGSSDSSSSSASDITYSNSTSGMTATNVQAAVDELKNDIDTLPAVFTPAGSVAFASLPSLTAGNVGKIVNVTDAFTTTSNFVEGSGKSYPAGTNVAIVDVGSGSSHSYKYDAMSGFVDLSGKADKVSGAVNGDVPLLNSSGNLTDSGMKPGLDTTDWSDIITPLPGQPTEGIIISPEERQVGWYYNMDGSGTKKPIYQKRVHFDSITMPADSQYSDTPLSSDTTLELVNAYGTFLADGYIIIIPSSGMNRGNGLFHYYASVRSNVSSGIISLIIVAYSTSSWLSSITDVNITIQYTKTTDTYA